MKQSNQPKVDYHPSTTLYDLNILEPQQYLSALAIFLHDANHIELMEQRKRIAKKIAVMHNGSSEQKALYKRIEKIDEKIAFMLLSALIGATKKHSISTNSRTVSLREYMSEFVKTQEQLDLFKDFSRKLDHAKFLADVLESYLTDAKETLKKLDSTCVLTEFDGVNEALKAINGFANVHGKNEHEELAAIFSDYAEEIEIYLTKKCHDFYNEFVPVQQRLLSEGKIEKNSFDVADQRYKY